MTTLIKQPSESRVYAIDFRNLLVTGDTLDTVVSLTVAPGGLVLGTAALDTVRVRFRVSEGTPGTQYKLTCVVTTTGGDTLEGEGDLEVTDL